MDDGHGGELSKRQRECVELALDGSTNKEIARALGVRESTVKNHLSLAYDALGVDGGNRRMRAAHLLWAADHGRGVACALRREEI